LRELAIDLSDLPAFIADVKELLSKIDGFLPFGLGLWMRFVRASDNWMGAHQLCRRFLDCFLSSWKRVNDVLSC
jgi:hypothetical protein